MPTSNLFKPHNPKNLLENLFHNKNSEKYNDLKEFKKRIAKEKGSTHTELPYNSGKKKALFYQSVFFGLGLLFLIITTFMYTQTMNWSGSLFFVNYTATKMVVCLFTFTLAIIACALGYSITTEKEAANQMIHRTQSKLKQTLALKKAEFGINRFPFGVKLKKGIAATHLYEDAVDKIKEHKKVTFTLLEHIADDKTIEKKMAEKLFNQALLEFNDKLTFITTEFKDDLHKLLNLK